MDGRTGLDEAERVSNTQDLAGLLASEGGMAWQDGAGRLFWSKDCRPFKADEADAMTRALLMARRVPEPVIDNVMAVSPARRGQESLEYDFDTLSFAR